MNHLLMTLRARNPVLYGFGIVCLTAGMVCVGLALTTNVQVTGSNAFIKPLKFYVSVALFSWTIAWYLVLLRQQRAVRIYSWMVVITMTLELLIVTVQAGRGRMSHFNISSPVDGILFGTMGLLIVIFTIWTAYIATLFFTYRALPADAAYVWGIRLGLLLFVGFAFEGFLMTSQLRHTVGAPDGGPGLPVLNWSRQNGDLRVAHFFGMHALQLLPLFGYYVARRPVQVMLLAAFYVLVVVLLLVQALNGQPLLG